MLQVWDFDVAVKAQKEPVPCNTEIFSLAHMAPETITEKHVTKVRLLRAGHTTLICGPEGLLLEHHCRIFISHQLWIAVTLLLHVTSVPCLTQFWNGYITFLTSCAWLHLQALNTIACKGRASPHRPQSFIEVATNTFLYCCNQWASQNVRQVAS